MTALRIPSRGNKFSAKRTTVGELTFDSKREARRYGELRLLEQAGQIEALEVHPVYKLEAFTPGGLGAVKIGRYTADFAYLQHGQKVTEDVKSAATRTATDYRLRVRIFKANYPDIEFREVL